ncbi:MAG: hypothetical protein FJ311_05020 [Rhodospirillales bacterium]|nr:hypothetical protein [Rhodospirillales bacterium]
MAERIESEVLIEAGLAAMKGVGKPLVRLRSKGRSMIYGLPDGETVRVRTCNDHVLIVVGDSPAPDAKLNVEGTDWLLLVMPEIERTPGKTVSYLLPAKEVEAEARRTHKEWLQGNPNTKGDNRTWNLWFKKDAPAKANDYATKWSRYRLAVTINASEALPPAAPGRRTNIKSEVEDARRRIAQAAGVPVEAVKITINFEG